MVKHLWLSQIINFNGSLYKYINERLIKKDEKLKQLKKKLISLICVIKRYYEEINRVRFENNTKFFVTVK